MTARVSGHTYLLNHVNDRWKANSLHCLLDVDGAHPMHGGVGKPHWAFLIQVPGEEGGEKKTTSIKSALITT